MPGRVWELHDVKLGPSGEPPDTIIVRIPYREVTPTQAREEALQRMRSHATNKSSVEGIVIVDGDGKTVVRVTAWDVVNAPRT
jgi:hypothetical protein